MRDHDSGECLLCVLSASCCVIFLCCITPPQKSPFDAAIILKIQNGGFESLFNLEKWTTAYRLVDGIKSSDPTHHLVLYTEFCV